MSNIKEIESARAMYPGTLCISVDTATLIQIRTASESLDWEGRDLLAQDLTAAKPWRILCQNAR